MDPTTAARVSTLLMLASLGFGMCLKPAGAEEPKGTMSSVDSDSRENAVLPVKRLSFQRTDLAVPKSCLLTM